MTLQPLRLDDLNWRTMVDAIRGRIAAVSDEEWTLHAPVDPGVTLLELFAYLLEQRVFWLDQVPAALINGLVGLLGAERHPAIAATTLLELLKVGPLGTGYLDAGVVLKGGDQDAIMRLTTQEDAAVLPIARIDVAARFGAVAAMGEAMPRWATQPLTLMAADHNVADVQVTLWLSQPPAPDQVGRTLALLLDLDVPAKIPASWSTQAVQDVPMPAWIEWSYSADGPELRRTFVADAVQDGTQGLRRSGVVRLTIPAQWVPAQAAVNGLVPYRLWLKAEETSFSSPPRLRRVIPNVVVARHAVPVTVPLTKLESHVEQWLPLPGRILQLSDPSPPLEDSVALRLRGRDKVWRDWKPTWDFARHGPEDPVFLVDRLINCLRFGDGLTGRLPVLSKTAGFKAELHYLAGGGEAGNLGANLIWTCGDPEVEATNPVPVRGGCETETAAEARDRVAAALLERYRAVTAADYEALSIDTPGVAVQRAKAVPGFHPGFPCISVPGAITVFIVPDVPRGDGWLDSDRAVMAPQPDPGMLQHVRAHLEQRRLLTTELFVLGPWYWPVEVDTTLAGAPLDKAAVAGRLRDGLSLYLDPLVGGAEGAGWPFGQTVRPSEIAHQLQRLAGEDAVVERVAVRLVDPKKPDAPFEDCVDVVLADHELVVLQSLSLHWKPRADHRGGLR
jgi:predicted phage baseplate assembly protein